MVCYSLLKFNKTCTFSFKFLNYILISMLCLVLYRVVKFLMHQIKSFPGCGVFKKVVTFIKHCSWFIFTALLHTMHLSNLICACFLCSSTFFHVNFLNCTMASQLGFAYMYLIELKQNNNFILSIFFLFWTSTIVLVKYYSQTQTNWCISVGLFDYV